MQISYKNKKQFIALMSAIIIILAIGIFYANADNQSPGSYTFEVGIPGIVAQGQSVDVQGFPELIIKAIKFLYRIAILIAFVLIVYAGFRYMTSGGKAEQTKDALDQIYKALIGLAILFCSYLILYTINPDLVKIPEILFPKRTTTTIFNYENVQDQISYIIQSIESGAVKQDGYVINDLKDTKLHPGLVVVMDYIIKNSNNYCGQLEVGPIISGHADSANSCHPLGLAFDVDMKGNTPQETKECTKPMISALRSFVSSSIMLSPTEMPVITICDELDQESPHIHVCLRHADCLCGSNNICQP